MYMSKLTPLAPLSAGYGLVEMWWLLRWIGKMLGSLLSLVFRVRTPSALGATRAALSACSACPGGGLQAKRPSRSPAQRACAACSAAAAAAAPGDMVPPIANQLLGLMPVPPALLQGSSGTSVLFTGVLGLAVCVLLYRLAAGSGAGLRDGGGLGRMADTLCLGGITDVCRRPTCKPTHP